jgi:hypothetical protein
MQRTQYIFRIFDIQVFIYLFNPLKGVKLKKKIDLISSGGILNSKQDLFQLILDDARNTRTAHYIYVDKYVKKYTSIKGEYFKYYIGPLFLIQVIFDQLFTDTPQFFCVCFVSRSR